MEESKIKLKPVTYTTNYFKRGYQNTTQQMLLLKALKVTQDPEKLRDMLHMKKVVEVYQSIDKLVNRKEYHDALFRAGVSFDFIVNGIKGVALNAFKDGDRLKAYQVFLKSIGVDKYENDSNGSGGTWEEELLKSIESSKTIEEQKQIGEIIQYEVKQPEIPESAKKAMAEEEETTSSIYESKK